VSENKTLAHPASVDSIPVSASQEDHVSMGMLAARKALEVVRNARRVVATELVCAAQASDLISRGNRGAGTEAAWRRVRSAAEPMDADREFAGDIDRVDRLVAEGAFRPALLTDRTS